MIDFNYVQNMYDELSNSLLKSSFVINATIYIQGKDVSHESTYSGMGDMLDARHTKPVQQDFPLDLARQYRVQVFPMERNYVKREGEPIQHVLAGKFEPFDRWISCLESDVSVKDGQVLYDYSDRVSISGVSYRIKAIHREAFGLKPIIHAFLVKESDE